MSKFKTLKKRKKNINDMCIGEAHLQCVNNHYAKLEYKGMNTIKVTDLYMPCAQGPRHTVTITKLQITQTRHPLSISDGKMSKLNTHQK